MSPASEADNVRFLRGCFVSRLLRERPSCTLDIGCGDAALLLDLAAAGHRGHGVEPSAQACADAARRGAFVVRGSATHLPCATNSVAWATLRHVPHHLPDPKAAFAEASRVARLGLLIAEPWFDPALPGQAHALAVDLWLKQQHRRAGQVHRPVLSAEQLRAALPTSRGWDIEVQTAIRLAARPLEPLDQEVRPLLDALPPEHPDRTAWQRLRAAIATDGVTWNGTLILIATARSA